MFQDLLVISIVSHRQCDLLVGDAKISSLMDSWFSTRDTWKAMKIVFFQISYQQILCFYWRWIWTHLFNSLFLLVQAKFHIIQELLGKLHATVANSQKTEACQSLLDELNDERKRVRHVMKEMFNRSFGATFMTDTGQESAFAYHIYQYADVYTSKPENFLLYPSEAWLHVPYDIKILPHHVKVGKLLYFWKKKIDPLNSKILWIFMFHLPACWLPQILNCLQYPSGTSFILQFLMHYLLGFLFWTMNEANLFSV